jgi:hypothetical protein
VAQLIANIPWWLLAGCILAGIVLLVHGNRANKNGLRSAGVLIVSLTLLLVAAHYLIDTPAEKATRMTRQIVDSVDKADWTRLRGLLDPKTEADFAGHRGNVSGGDAIAQAAQESAAAVGLKSAAIWSLRTEQTDATVSVSFVAYTMQEQSQDRAVPSSWEFDWNLLDGKPHLTKITLVSLGNQ